MLFDPAAVLRTLRSYGVEPRGVLHVGAHSCQEKPYYNAWGIPDSNIVWVDAIAEYTRQNKARGIPNCYTAVLDEESRERTLYITSDLGQSSSILERGTHASSYPGIVVTEARQVKTQSLSQFVKNAGLDLATLNIWNFDIQGAEFHVLRGSSELLASPEAIFTEVNITDVYKGCGQLKDLDTLLGAHGFVRVSMTLDPANWGDALYVRIPTNAIIAAPPAGGGIGNQLFNVLAAWCAARELGRPLYITTPMPHQNSHNTYQRNYTDIFFKDFGRILPYADSSPEFHSIPFEWFQKSTPFEPWYSYELPATRVCTNDYHQYCQPLLRNEPEIHTKLHSILSQFDSTPRDTSAFLHVRRGDYLYSSILPPKPVEYYEKAVARLLEKNPSIEKILIFSDGLDWVREQPFFKSPVFEIVECDDELKVLAMMASCTAGAICANSTFSWWGAFLGAHHKKNPVIVPSDWILNYEVIDLFPYKWEKL